MLNKAELGEPLSMTIAVKPLVEKNEYISQLLVLSSVVNKCVQRETNFYLRSSATPNFCELLENAVDKAIEGITLYGAEFQYDHLFAFSTADVEMIFVPSINASTIANTLFELQNKIQDKISLLITDRLNY